MQSARLSCVIPSNKQHSDMNLTNSLWLATIADMSFVRRSLSPTRIDLLGGGRDFLLKLRDLACVILELLRDR